MAGGQSILVLLKTVRWVETIFAGGQVHCTRSTPHTAVPPRLLRT